MLDVAVHSQVVDLLRAGYGAEDVAVKLNLPAAAIRAQIKRARDRGSIYHLLGTDPARNAEALRIMGVRGA